ncbi:hypothetical protein ACHAWF_016256 [Thalassiosira exigua]
MNGLPDELSDAGDDGGSAGGAREGGEGGSRPYSYLSEGYTPLNFNMNALVLDDGGDNGSDGDDTDETDRGTDGDFHAGGYYHMMGAPPRRMNGVKDGVLGLAMHSDFGDDASSEATNNGSDNGNESDNGNSHADSDFSERLEVPIDFHLMAEQALRGLDIEHSNVNDSTFGTPAESDDLPPNLAEADAKSELLNVTPAVKDADFEKEVLSGAASDSAAKAPTPKIKPMPKVNMRDPVSPASKHMDAGAIHKAMQSIRLKSPQLADTLDAGASSAFSTHAMQIATDAALSSIIDSTSEAIDRSRHEQPSSHNIIPPGPLAAFRRSTKKAQAASANLTRSATISEAVFRLWPLICFRRRIRMNGVEGMPSKRQQMSNRSRTLVIHILGADGVECTSEESVRKSVGPFVRWMDAAFRSGALAQPEPKSSSEKSGESILTGCIDSLLIEFSGPNIPPDLVGNVLDLLTHSSVRSDHFLSAKATFQQREYHDVPESLGRNQSSADIAIAFNAGIWGYDSWKPTLSFMCEGEQNVLGEEGLEGGTLFVITAYTIEECEDDAEVVAEVVKARQEVASKKPSSHLKDGISVARQLWIPETNPFSSRLERKTSSAPHGRKYFENAAWQAWLLGS